MRGRGIWAVALVAIAAVASYLTNTERASAAQILTYTLSGVTFNDGGTATGSFTVELPSILNTDATNTVIVPTNSPIISSNIVTSADTSSGFPQTTYEQGGALFNVASGNSFNGNATFTLASFHFLGTASPGPNLAPPSLSLDIPDFTLPATPLSFSNPTSPIIPTQPVQAAGGEFIGSTLPVTDPLHLPPAGPSRQAVSGSIIPGPISNLFNIAVIRGPNQSKDNQPISISATATLLSPGLTLQSVAQAMGYVGFDWIQEITNLPDPSDFYLENGSHLTSASTPFPDAGEAYCYNGYNINGNIVQPGCSGSPYYYPASSAENDSNQCIEYDSNVNCLQELVTGNDTTLNFFDAPADSCLSGGLGLGCNGQTASSGEALEFETELVGILPNGKPSDPLDVFTWSSSYNGCGGPVPSCLGDGGVQLGSETLPDTSGTGGVNVLSIDDMPVPEPTSLTLLLSGTLLLLLVTHLPRRRKNNSFEPPVAQS